MIDIDNMGQETLGTYSLHHKLHDQARFLTYRVYLPDILQLSNLGNQIYYQGLN